MNKLKEMIVAYIKETYPATLDNHWNYDLVDNIVYFALKEKSEDKDMFYQFLISVLPEITTEDLDACISDDIDWSELDSNPALALEDIKPGMMVWLYGTLPVEVVAIKEDKVHFQQWGLENEVRTTYKTFKFYRDERKSKVK